MSILNFCAKCRKALILETECDSNLGQMFGLEDHVRYHLVDFQEIALLLFFVAIQNFCVKCKNAFILETVQDRVISRNFLAQGVYSKSYTCFPKMHSPAIFQWLNFRVKQKKCIYLRTMRDRAIWLNFDMEGIYKIICLIFEKLFYRHFHSHQTPPNR